MRRPSQEVEDLRARVEELECELRALQLVHQFLTTDMEQQRQQHWEQQEQQRQQHQEQRVRLLREQAELQQANQKLAAQVGS